MITIHPQIAGIPVVEDGILYQIVTDWDGNHICRSEVTRIGKLHTLGHRKGPKGESWFLAPEEGIGGNLNPDRLATTGWRGTTNGVATYAEGVWRVTRVRILDNGKASVTLKEVE